MNLLDRYKARAQKNSPRDPIEALAWEIWACRQDFHGKKPSFPFLKLLIQRKGVKFAREEWMRVSKDKAVRSPWAVWHKVMHQTHIDLHEV